MNRVSPSDSKLFTAPEVDPFEKITSWCCEVEEPVVHSVPRPFVEDPLFLWVVLQQNNSTLLFLVWGQIILSSYLHPGLGLTFS